MGNASACMERTATSSSWPSVTRSTTSMQPLLCGDTRVPDQPTRREFIGRLGATSAAAFVGEGTLDALTNANSATSSETWDMSWVEKLKAPTYKAVIDANALEDG